jgi:hypothetical protein
VIEALISAGGALLGAGVGGAAPRDPWARWTPSSGPPLRGSGAWLRVSTTARVMADMLTTGPAHPE